MKKTLAIFMLCSALVMSITGCQDRRTLGAVGGAAVGATVGGLAGNTTGAIIGGVAGAALGSHLSKPKH